MMRHVQKHDGIIIQKVFLTKNLTRIVLNIIYYMYMNFSVGTFIGQARVRDIHIVSNLSSGVTY